SPRPPARAPAVPPVGVPPPPPGAPGPPRARSPLPRRSSGEAPCLWPPRLARTKTSTPIPAARTPISTQTHVGVLLEELEVEVVVTGTITRRVVVCSTVVVTGAAAGAVVISVVVRASVVVNSSVVVSDAGSVVAATSVAIVASVGVVVVVVCAIPVPASKAPKTKRAARPEIAKPPRTGATPQRRAGGTRSHRRGDPGQEPLIRSSCRCARTRISCHRSPSCRISERGSDRIASARSSSRWWRRRASKRCRSRWSTLNNVVIGVRARELNASAGSRRPAGCVEGVESVHVVGPEGEVEDLCVRLDAVLSTRLRDDGDVVLDRPAQQHLRRGTSEPVRDLDDPRVGEGASSVERAVGLEHDPVLL